MTETLAQQPQPIDVLNAVQQTLRHVVVALAVEARADKARLASMLAAASAQESLEPMARAMLADLAEGLAVLGSAGRRKN